MIASLIYLVSTSSWWFDSVAVELLDRRGAAAGSVPARGQGGADGDRRLITLLLLNLLGVIDGGVPRLGKP
jgi:hypothetical protein